MRIHDMHKAVSLLVLALFMHGCVVLAAGAVVGTGAFAYFNGWMRRDYQTTVAKAYDASLKACSALNLPVSKKEKSLTSASITAKDGKNDVWFNISDKGDGWVTVEIKDGLIGDEDAARKIHEKLHTYL